ncbi:DinB family protein [Paenibacillus sp. D2_2]|uniref:DinB family protein n=1 Tax=Paenibacillus sp. D2_2 TaxID=3073092 RepID=UPI002814E1BE|nr:DinB family protein [Paenibacillus sp. D2_2]WMT38926.1 DinB family protein [Paenibacillus sp. D2_2]
MAKTSTEMIEEYDGFISFVASLCDLEDRYWDTPIAEGKWTVKDIVCHIMLWDKYFYEEAIEKIKLGEPLTLKHQDFNQFNAHAIQYAKSQTKQELYDQFVEYRKKIIQSISGLRDEEYLLNYVDGDGRKFSIYSYLRGFVPHDKHHKKQIQSFIKSLA